MPLIERYWDRLPFEKGDPIVSLGEGSTPLVHAPKLSERLEADVFLKLEGANPTGSFKDRGMTVAVSHAKRSGAEAVICASTGNTAASAAAYAARGGMKAFVLVPEGKIARGKLAQAKIHGAKVIAVKGNFDVALAMVRMLAARHKVELVNSLNPYRLEGQKTAAFEVCDDLGTPPDALAIPIGNAGNITAWWQGFQEMNARPILYGVQADGAAPCVYGWRPVDDPETLASAIRIGNPVRMAEAREAVESSGGKPFSVYDEPSAQPDHPDATILGAHRWLAEQEGVFCEPASAAAVAGLLRGGLPVKEGWERPKTVVCVLTGHGLKDPMTAIENTPPVITLEPDLEAIEHAIFA